MLIVAGVLLFLDNLGLLPIPDIRAYWPVWMIIWGVTSSIAGEIWSP